jgi:hypothetical protein
MHIVPEWPPVACNLYLRGGQSHANFIHAACDWQPHGYDLHATGGYLGTHKPGLRIRIHFIRIQHFRLNTDPDPIRIQSFKDQKILKKLLLEKKILWIKNYNLPIPRLP